MSLFLKLFMCFSVVIIASLYYHKNVKFRDDIPTSGLDYGLFFKQLLLNYLNLLTQFITFWYRKFSCLSIFSLSDSPLLAIGILSARENLSQRKAIRSTWLNNFRQNENIPMRAWFILGNDSCKIPPEYRINKYTCEKWNVNTTDTDEHFYSSYEISSKACPSNMTQMFHQGFSFKVNHPVIVQKLGILSSLLTFTKEAKVAILDVQRKVIVIQASILVNSSDSKHGYLYQEVEGILFPKGYEGMVLVEGSLLHSSCSTIVWNNNGGVITYNRIYSTPSHMDSIMFSPDIFVAASIEFLVHDINNLKEIKLQEEIATVQWRKYLRNINKNILIERKQNQDVLIVDIIDIYRNLPSKLLHFYKWLKENHDFLYAMKTDDDCVIDVPRLLQVLKTSAFYSSEYFIWSRFRKEWPVNYIGKWADFDYRSSLYPSFPCGAAYILSQKAVFWLSSNSEDLHSYQGEDVSMGIWLSAIRPEFIEDENFECDSQCNRKSYNRAQLTTDQIYDVWSLYEECQNLCSCD